MKISSLKDIFLSSINYFYFASLSGKAGLFYKVYCYFYYYIYAISEEAPNIVAALKKGDYPIYKLSYSALSFIDKKLPLVAREKIFFYY